MTVIPLLGRGKKRCTRCGEMTRYAFSVNGETVCTEHVTPEERAIALTPQD
jgi:formylmethanofuran dehydrogenase subunit E